VLARTRAQRGDQAFDPLFPRPSWPPFDPLRTPIVYVARSYDLFFLDGNVRSFFPGAGELPAQIRTFPGCLLVTDFARRGLTGGQTSVYRPVTGPAGPRTGDVRDNCAVRALPRRGGRAFDLKMACRAKRARVALA